ncbi:hypothetical protein BB560_001146 [Smittium megazygosporum]|uniref:RING-type domain-containing protein n=1 Tax=Smittium megazygosporum TaxID=133381 RepID=A0A2T9ZIC2_9FUNG|nr:hypothetical protein BB560_001146 [Smittium megazygosporum]
MTNSPLPTSELNLKDQQDFAFGCEHYKHGAKLLAECCNEFYYCHLCHDEKCKYELNRYTVKTVKCLYCENIQDIGQYCVKCKKCLGEYYCDKCKLLDDNASKKIFHCEKCGICRKGGKENYYHCDGCSACLSVDARGSHKCVDKSLYSNCPVCMEYLFTSTSPIIVLYCGHPIHKTCVNELLKFSSEKNEEPPTCPICHRSIIEPKVYSAEMDKIMAQQPMPPEYKDKTSKVFCNDCQRRSDVPYHFVYHKCASCGSYNTVLV